MSRRPCWPSASIAVMPTTTCATSRRHRRRRPIWTWDCACWRRCVPRNAFPTIPSSSTYCYPSTPAPPSGTASSSTLRHGQRERRAADGIFEVLALSAHDDPVFLDMISRRGEWGVAQTIDYCSRNKMLLRTGLRAHTPVRHINSPPSAGLGRSWRSSIALPGQQPRRPPAGLLRDHHPRPRRLPGGKPPLRLRQAGDALRHAGAQ